MAYQAGQKLGNYQLEGFLGYGGFAEVYLGKHIYLNTQAAIKVLQRQTSAETLEQFLQEARIIAGLKHPHIVSVLEFGIEEQRPFLVMAYAPHGTLRKRYSRGNVLSPTTILPHIKQIAEALQYAHEARIIHRDVKPDNMLLDEHDTILLSDFGLALREHGTYQSARSTDSAGTTIYMAPEQLRGKPCAASDQYALGVVMYEWLCGCLPFDGPDVSIVVQHLHEPPEPLRKHVPQLSVEVEAVVLKALEKDPKQRFATVQELAIAFEKACQEKVGADGAVAGSHIEDNKYEDVKLVRLLPEAAANSVELQVSPSQKKALDGVAVSEVPWPSHYSSLKGPSLSASLNVSAPAKDANNVSMAPSTLLADADAPTVSSNNAPVSRRMLIAGIAGIGVVALGGVGLWRFSSSRVGPLFLDMQTGPKSSGATTPVITSNRGGSGKSGTGGTAGTNSTSSASSAGSNGAVKNGTGKPVTVSKGRTTGASTPTTAATPTPASNTGNGGNPIATSTPDTSNNAPGVTPVATDPPVIQPPAPLTSVQMSNVPSSVRNDTTVDIFVTTNVGNASFQFEADYSGFRARQPDIGNGTTDTNGNATVSWTPSVAFGLLFFRATATLHVTATDQNGNSVSSQNVQVQIAKF